MRTLAFKRYSQFLMLLMLPMTLLCGALYVWDPLDIRPWGEPTPLVERPYPLIIRPLLAPGITRSEKAVVLFGSSTILPVREAQLRTLVDGGDAANLSQAQQRVADGSVLLENVAKTPGLERLVVEVSFIWLYPNEATLETGRRLEMAYEPTWHDLPSFDREIMRAGLSGLAGDGFWTEEWTADSESFAPTGPSQLPDWRLRQIAEASQALGPEQFASTHSPTDCSELPELERGMRQMLQQAQDRGFQADIFFSPVPFASYPFLAQQQRGYLQAYGHDEPFFEKLMQMQFCVVTLVDEADYPGARIYDLNLDAQIVGDLRGMRDPLHITMAYKFDRMMDDLNGRAGFITRANFPDYRRRLSDAIVATLGQDLPPSAPPASK